MLSEPDVRRTIRSLRGVTGGGERVGGMSVRGGSPDQNLFLLDGTPVFNSEHILGIFSVFNPDIVKNASLYKGAFPARYAGRLSSVVDISMKDGNMNELHGDFSIGLLSTQLTLEGPLKKEKSPCRD